MVSIVPGNIGIKEAVMGVATSLMGAPVSYTHLAHVLAGAGVSHGSVVFRVSDRFDVPVGMDEMCIRDSLYPARPQGAL